MSLGTEELGASALAEYAVLARWQAWVIEASARGQALRLQGGNSKAFYGRQVDGVVLDTREYSGILAYEPTELVITARCGTPLAEIEATLAAQGQMLAFEPPRFGGESSFVPTIGGESCPTPTIGGESCPTPTIGGVVAAGLSGPRRMAVGAVRDFVLGVRVMNGHGELLTFGGQVMKNVAGYDVSRLMAGSLGCLGLITEVSLKVVPLPRVETSLCLELPQRAALERLNQWAGRSLPISASAWESAGDGGRLTVRLSGAGAAVDAARKRLGGEVIAAPVAAAYWQGLRDQTHPFFAADDSASGLIRLAVPDTAPPFDLPQPQLIEWGGAQRWVRVASGAHNLQKNGDGAARAMAVGGHATLFRAPAGFEGEVFTPLAAPLLRIHRELKRVFDPAGIFNRGRMYADD